MGERAIAAEARDLTKDFDGTRAVDRVNLTVPEGSITGITWAQRSRQDHHHPHDAPASSPDLRQPEPAA
jgi:hypothetical protein